MALREYTIEVLGNRSVLRVLKTLHRYRGKVFTVRELARTAGVSHPEASTVVRNLEKRAIVKLQPVGRAYQVSLNEESYILKAIVEPIFAAEQNTVKALISSIRPFFADKRIFSVAIFGSVARGQEKTTSDIDLLIITEDPDYANECVSKANLVSVSRFGFVISHLILSRTRFIRDRNADLERSILESYLMVSGMDLKKMISNVKAH